MEQLIVQFKMETKYLFRFMMLTSTLGIVNKLVWIISLICLVAFPFSFTWNNPTTIFALGIVIFMNLISRPFGFYAKAKQQMLTNDLYRQPMTYYFDEAGIALNDQGEQLPWDHLVGVKETKNMYLLYIGPMQAFIIPKVALKDASEHETFKHILSIANITIKK